jgi:hypothetical protein
MVTVSAIVTTSTAVWVRSLEKFFSIKRFQRQSFAAHETFSVLEESCASSVVCRRLRHCWQLCGAGVPDPISLIKNILADVKVVR